MFVSTATVCYINCCSVLLRDCPVWYSHVYQPSRVSVANQTPEGGFHKFNRVMEPGPQGERDRFNEYRCCGGAAQINPDKVLEDVVLLTFIFLSFFFLLTSFLSH